MAKDNLKSRPLTEQDLGMGAKPQPSTNQESKPQVTPSNTNPTSSNSSPTTNINTSGGNSHGRPAQKGNNYNRGQIKAVDLITVEVAVEKIADVSIRDLLSTP